MIFVDHDVAKPIGVFISSIRGCLKQCDGFEQEVIEIQRAARAKYVEVAFIDFSELFVTKTVAVFANIGRAFHLVFGVANARKYRLWRGNLVINIQVLHRLSNHVKLIN